MARCVAENRKKALSSAGSFAVLFNWWSWTGTRANASGVIRADLEGRGARIGAYDVLIAGIALARGHVLATHNVREFGRVTGLQIEDWAAIP